MTIKKKELFILYGETYLKLRTENQIDKSNITYSIPLDYEGQVPIFLEIKNATSSKVIDYQIIDESNSGGTSRYSHPSILIANKGAGPGKEKVVISYNAVGSTPSNRSEMRIIQKDVYKVGYEELILSDINLVGYWRLNERDDVGTGNMTRADDISFTRNNGTYVNLF